MMHLETRITGSFVLKVSVVTEGKCLERNQQIDQLADDTAGFSSYDFDRIRVLLLWHETEDVVTLSENLMKPNSEVFQMMSVSHNCERCTLVSPAAAAKSTAKSRSITASIEFLNTEDIPSCRALNDGSIPSAVPA